MGEVYDLGSALAVDQQKKDQQYYLETIWDWVWRAPGEFNVSDVDRDLSFVTPEDRKMRTFALETFVAEGHIEREGSKRGWYRPEQRETRRINFSEASSAPVDMWLPFNLHKMVAIMPSNIIVVAGEPNAGKTALLLNIASSNRKRSNVNYFSSEMDAGELKSRLIKFDCGLVEWERVNFWDRQENFSDVIVPGKGSLNIIDFLEVHDEFYKIGKWITEIYAKLKGAVAVIAIQKNTGQEHGLGGQRSMEKARLALSCSPGKILITKAKNFIDPEFNPNNHAVKYKLVQGAKLIQQGEGWYKNWQEK